MPMKAWKHSIQLIDLYDKYEADDDFLNYGTAVVNRLEETKLFPQGLLDTLRETIFLNDLDEWDSTFSYVYDFCDENRIWLVVEG
jgi:hypothetical protein